MTATRRQVGFLTKIIDLYDQIGGGDKLVADALAGKTVDELQSWEASRAIRSLKPRLVREGLLATTRERREARADRLDGWADKRDDKASELYARGDKYRGDIAFNTQPGHIPERARIIRATERAFEHSTKAASMRSRADGIRNQVDEAIYDDDPDAIERLEEKLARLEARRAEMKAKNAAYRKEHKDELKAMSPYERSIAVPHAGYELSNLGGTITKTRQRLERLREAGEMTD